MILNRLLANKYRICNLALCLLFAVLLTGCDSDDDLNEIFVGKTWYIHGGRYGGTDFTGDEIKSLYASSGTYYITFGASNFSGVLASGTSISGTWAADGGKHTISFNVSNSSGSSNSLSSKISNIISGATSYSGSSVTLTIKKDDGNYILLNRDRTD